MNGRIQANFPELPPMVGYAATASFRSDAPPVGGDAYGSIQAQLEQFAKLPGPAVVVFQDLDDPPAGVIATRYSSGLISFGTPTFFRRARSLVHSCGRYSR